VIPVEQRLFFDASTGERGDCLKCCIASLLELDYDDVPHFAAMGDMWWIEWTNWLAARGWQLYNAYHRVADDDPARLTGYTCGYWLASVTSRRTRPDGSNISHMILMRDGEVAWDPHPARADGHLGFTEGQILVPLDPARFVLRETT
jgi:hypothetical protein